MYRNQEVNHTKIIAKSPFTNPLRLCGHHCELKKKVKNKMMCSLFEANEKIGHCL